MEENKQKEEPKKLTYEELNQAASNLHIQHQRLQAEYNKLRAEYANAVDALQDKSFNFTSFFISMLFKVVENDKMFPEEFVKWASLNIEGSLKSYVEAIRQKEEPAEEKKDETK